MSDKDRYTFFWAGPFSQWHVAPFQVEGRHFNCAEQYMMYCKAVLFDDHGAAAAILATKSAREQKSLGRKVIGFDESKWKFFREGVVFSGNLAKFSQNESLRLLLLATAQRIIVEASPKDAVWGVGLAEDDPRILSPINWRGENLLGKILMRVRSCVSSQLPLL